MWVVLLCLELALELFAESLLAKHLMSVFPKIGTIGGTSLGYTILYRLSRDNLSLKKKITIVLAVMLVLLIYN